MKYAIKVDADNRDINVSVSVKKEEGEPDFFKSIEKVFDDENKLCDIVEPTDVVDVD